MNRIKRLGLLGGGQLAQMLALAAQPLGISTNFIDPSPDACAASVAGQLQGAWNDQSLLEALAKHTDVISFEFENVPTEALEYLASRHPIWPPPIALSSGQDRLLEKQLFDDLEIDVTPYRPVSGLEEINDAIRDLRLPAILKTRRQGYDGKGQALIRTQAQIAAAWQSLGERPCLLESLVDFEREVSIIAVRTESGEIRCWPLTENRHQQGILIESIARQNDPMQKLAEAYIKRLLEHLGYVGVLALELFESQGQLLANEFAPRVHNSGHWTQNGAETCQFENHVRAVFGLPLGSTRPIGHAAMFNCIGQMPDRAQVLSIPGAHLHDYGKAPRPGRKLGHVNLRADSPEALAEAMARLRPLLKNQLA